jgi:IMP dehydrogenase
MQDIRKVLSYNDVLLCPRNSELDHLSDADIEYYYGETVACFPVINAPMDTICSPDLLRYLNMNGFPVTIHRWFNSAVEQLKFFESCNFNNGAPFCFLSVGIKQKWEDWIDRLLAYRATTGYVKFDILIDVANGDTKQVVETIKYIREHGEMNIKIMAGNVATRSGFGRLQDAGANFIRCGIGGGSVCQTRTATAFGMPTFTTILDCAKVKDTAYLVADGGIEYNGDICKAIAAGADMVMVGKLFAGTNLANNIKYDSKFKETKKEKYFKYCQYRGMASREANEKLQSKKTAVSIEGISGLVPYKGTTENVVKELLGNLHSAVAYYAGCRDWEEFRRKVKFLEISSQGWEESKTRLV